MTPSGRQQAGGTGPGGRCFRVEADLPMWGRPGKREVRWLSTAEAPMKTVALLGFLLKTGIEQTFYFKFAKYAKL